MKSSVNHFENEKSHQYFFGGPAVKIWDKDLSFFKESDKTLIPNSISELSMKDVREKRAFKVIHPTFNKK